MKDEQTKTAFASASDTSKQLITLATGLLALEITFVKDIIQNLDSTARYLLCASWLLLLLSIIAGVWTLLALTGTLTQKHAPTPQSIYANNVRLPAFLQVLLFLGGLIFTVWLGIHTIFCIHGI
jgi:hypothetical protein